MMLDYFTQIAVAYGYQGSGATYIDTSNILDRTIAQEEGSGEELCSYIFVHTAWTTANSSTLRAGVVGNISDATFNGGTLAGGGNIILADTGTIATGSVATTFPAGANWKIPWPRQTWGASATNADYEAKTSFIRYVTFFLVQSAACATGAFDAWIGPAKGFQDNISYKCGFTV